MTLFEIIGTIGVAMVVIAYFFVQSGRWTHRDLALPLTNLAGALLILASLYDTPNLPSIIIECIWIAISLYGLWHIWRQRKRPKWGVMFTLHSKKC